jgi:hypothetical protein
MTTDPQPTPPSGPTSPPPGAASRGRRRLLLGIAALGFLLLLIAAWLLFSSTPNQSITLISPAEAARAMSPRPFAQLRYKIRQFIYPVWRHFQRRLQSVTINGTVLGLPPLTAEQTGLGPPAATNASGLRAWVVPVGELDTIKARLKAIPGCDADEPRSVYAANGFPAAMSFRSKVRVRKGTPGPDMHIAITSSVLDLEVTPTIRPGSLSLLISASDCVFGFVPQATTTNFEAAFKATLPPSGAIVLCDELHTNESGKLEWLLLSATSLDTHGKPIPP